MRLLLIAREIESIESIKNFSGVWAYYLVRELRRIGVDLRFDAPLHMAEMTTDEILDHYQTLDLEGIDHVLALGNRYFTRVHPNCAAILKKRLNGAVTQIHDNPTPNSGVDCTFTLCEGKPRANGKSHLVGWAADPDICCPRQAERTLGILVDHPDYVENRGDRSNEILESALTFISSDIWRKRFDTVKLWRIADGDIVEHEGGAVGAYHRKTIPFMEACEFYGKAHLFFTTHPESVGLTVLETAMSGALPVVPTGYVSVDRLNTVRHISYDGDIPWSNVLEEIDIDASRQVALRNTWSGIAGSIVDWLHKWRKLH